MATWCEKLIHWRRPWYRERLKAGGEGDNRGWHHLLDEHEFEQAPGVGDGQGSLESCSPWGRKESDMTEWLNWTELIVNKPIKEVKWTHSSSVGKESACSAGDLGSISGLERSSGEGNGNPLQYPSLENLLDRGVWWAAVHGVTKSQSRLRD